MDDVLGAPLHPVTLRASRYWFSSVRYYVLAILLTGAANALVLLIDPFLPHPFLLPFFGAVMASGWVGGFGPGMFAVLLSTLIVDYYFIPPLHALGITVQNLPYFSAFVISALLSAWLGSARRSAEVSLRLARDKLEERVAERTSELQRTNDALRAEIADRKRAQDALRATQAELAHVTRAMTMGEIVASIAHEINQPLVGVLTNGDACLRWLDGDPVNLDEARDAARRIVRDGNRAREVMVRVRALLKRSDPHKSLLDVHRVIDDVISVVQSELREHGVSLRFEPAPDLPRVMADPVQLQQVLLNLILNGIEAMSTTDGHQRVLRIRTHDYEAEEILVAVDDSGVGMGPREMDQIFAAFFTTKTDGLGMGLSISRSIVEAHGGRLWAISDPGHGATFQFTLPVAPLGRAPRGDT